MLETFWDILYLANVNVDLTEPALENWTTKFKVLRMMKRFKEILSYQLVPLLDFPT